MGNEDLWVFAGLKSKSGQGDHIYLLPETQRVEPKAGQKNERNQFQGGFCGR